VRGLNIMYAQFRPASARPDIRIRDVSKERKEPDPAFA